jgi:hypothetical protein
MCVLAALTPPRAALAIGGSMHGLGFRVSVRGLGGCSMGQVLGRAGGRAGHHGDPACPTPAGQHREAVAACGMDPLPAAQASSACAAWEFSVGKVEPASPPLGSFFRWQHVTCASDPSVFIFAPIDFCLCACVLSSGPVARGRHSGQLGLSSGPSVRSVHLASWIHLDLVWLTEMGSGRHRCRRPITSHSITCANMQHCATAHLMQAQPRPLCPTESGRT